MSTIADAVAASLAAAGTTHLFGVPGGGSTQLIRAAADAGIGFVLSRTETGGVLMAAAQADRGSAPGAALTALGPGITAAANGMAHALLDRSPVLVFSDAMKGGRRESGTHQRLDHQGVVRHLVKRSLTLGDQPREDLAAAIGTAMRYPPGPVHVEASGYVLGLDAPHEGVTTPDTGREANRDSAWTSRATRAMSRARNPVLLVGLQVRSDRDAEAVRNLSLTRRLPTFTTYKAKGVLPADHPFWAGTFTGGPPEAEVLERSDLIIAVGLDPVELLPRPWSFSQPVLFAGAWDPGVSTIRFASKVVGDIADLLEQAGELLRSSEWADEAITAHRSRLSRALTAKRTSRWITPQAVVTSLAQAVRKDDQLTVDAGAHMLPIMALFPPLRHRATHISNGLSTMAYALPTAIGLSVREPARNVWATVGDAGILMGLGELATVAKERLNIKVIVFDDQAMTLIQLKQAHGTPRNALITGSINWQAIGAGIGIPADLVSTPTELDRALTAAAAQRGPVLIGVRVQAREYERIYRVLRGA